MYFNLLTVFGYFIEPCCPCSSGTMRRSLRSRNILTEFILFNCQRDCRNNKGREKRTSEQIESFVMNHGCVELSCHRGVTLQMRLSVYTGV